MKTMQQVLGFIDGWEKAISTDDEEFDNDNAVLNTLKEIRAYICLDNAVFSEDIEKEKKRSH